MLWLAVAGCAPRGAVPLMCDGPGGPIGEFYRLSVLNRTIQTYPDFAAAV